MNTSSSTSTPSLFPVQHLIFDILKYEIPFKLLTVSQASYDQVIPTIYEEVKLNQKNIKPFFYGIFPPFGRESQRDAFERKVKSFSFIKKITFQDDISMQTYMEAIELYKIALLKLNDSSISALKPFNSIQDVHLGIAYFHPSLMKDLSQRSNFNKLEIDWQHSTGDVRSSNWSDFIIPELSLNSSCIKNLKINIDVFHVHEIRLDFINERKDIKININILCNLNNASYIVMFNVQQHFRLLWENLNTDTQKNKLNVIYTLTQSDANYVKQQFKEEFGKANSVAELNKLKLLERMVVFREEEE